MKLVSKKTKSLLVWTCILYVVDSIIVSAQVYYNAKIITYAEKGNLESVVWQVLGCCILLLIEYLVLTLATTSCMAYLSHGEKDVKNDIMKNILSRPLEKFRGESDAFYLNLFSTDVELYRDDFLNSIPFLVNAVATLIAASVMLLKLHPLFLIAALAASILPSITVKPFTSMMQKSKKAYSKAAEEYTNVVKENIEAYETIRVNCSESVFSKKHEEANASRQKTWARYSVIGKMSFETLMSVAGFSAVACLGVGGYLVSKKIVEAGMLLAAVNYFSMLSNQFSNISSYVVSIQSSKQVIQKLEEQRNVTCDMDKAVDLKLKPEITYDRVSFSFDEKELFHEFSYNFVQNGCYAVVGESGSGKSTLIKLLLKYYEQYTGNIFLGGQNIREMTAKELYQYVGVVEQTPYIFNSSLYDNVTLFSGHPKKDSEAYKELLRQLNLEDLAERVKEMPLGDFGDNISGGERQRINIARIMCKKPSIILFDEPTTGLDPENRILIEQFIFQRKDITRIVITHNWSQDYLVQFDGVVKIGEKKV